MWIMNFCWNHTNSTEHPVAVAMLKRAKRIKATSNHQVMIKHDVHHIHSTVCVLFSTPPLPLSLSPSFTLFQPKWGIKLVLVFPLRISSHYTFDKRKKNSHKKWNCLQQQSQHYTRTHTNIQTHTQIVIVTRETGPITEITNK